MCDTPTDSCKRCCRMNLNTSCFVMQPEEMLPDGTPCKTGFCNKGVCEPTMTDIVIRIWDFFEDFKFSSVMRFLKVSIMHDFEVFFQLCPTSFGKLFKNDNPRKYVAYYLLAQDHPKIQGFICFAQ